MADNQNQPALTTQSTSSSNQDVTAHIEKYLQDFEEVQENWKIASLYMRQNREYLELEMGKIMGNFLVSDESRQIENAEGFDQIEPETQQRMEGKRSDMVALYILMSDYLRMMK